VNRDDLRLFIRSVLRMAGLWSEEAEELLMGTFAQESALGKYRRQIGGGPGRGILQMEPATERDVWENYLDYRKNLSEKIRLISGVSRPDSEALENNLAYQVLMARIQYLRAPEKLPKDLDGMAALWKKRYNTAMGKGTEEEFIENYREMVA